MHTQPLTLSLCQHCGIPVTEGKAFCCSGCESVFALLQERGLTHYYTLKERFPMQPPKPVLAIGKLEIPEELTRVAQAKFYIEGIHCLGCLWLLEKLPEIEKGVIFSKLDIAHQILEVEIEKQKSWGDILFLLSRLGYQAKPLTLDDPAGVLERSRDQKKQLSRLAVAGFCTGNIMLLAVSLYGGADGWWAHHFQWLSFFLSIPVLTYSAWPLYISALYPLRKRRISVDLPIALALLAGLALSVWSLVFRDGSELYFDSLAMLVFLLLSSRYLLARLRESLAKETPSLSFLSSSRYLRLSPTKEEVKAKDLAPLDQLELCLGQTLPVDSVLSSDLAYFDLSLLTGESEPVKYQKRDRVESGAILLSEKALFEVERSAQESRLGQILEQIRVFQLNRSPSLEFADRMGGYFVVIVLALATITSVYFASSDFAEGMRRALSLVIVTCPCVLAFAVPLALTRSLQVAAKRGILFRGADKIEALSRVRNIFFDKTGTLTTGEFRLLEWLPLSQNLDAVKEAALSLESRSSHPIGKALTRAFHASHETKQVEQFREIQGFGVSGIVDGKRWRVHRLEPTSDGKNRVGIYQESTLEAIATFGDALRPEAIECVRKLETLGMNLMLLSGDAEANVRSAANSTHIKKWKHRLLPEAKAKIVREIPHSAMIGDGANDSIAFQAASVGVAMQGSVELSLKNADIALTKPGLKSFLEAILLSRSTMKLVKTNFSFTLAYNVVAGWLAIAGHMEPLFAATLMPLSALTVFLYTQWRTSWREL